MGSNSVLLTFGRKEDMEACLNDFKNWLDVWLEEAIHGILTMLLENASFGLDFKESHFTSGLGNSSSQLAIVSVPLLPRIITPTIFTDSILLEFLSLLKKRQLSICHFLFGQ